MVFMMDHCCYRPGVPKSAILPLAAAVTAVAVGASPALAAPLSAGRRDEVKAVAFPLLAVKGQAPANVGSHVSHSSHVSGSGGHVSHVSHSSHVSSVSVPGPATAVSVPTTAAPPPAPAVTTSPSLSQSPTATPTPPPTPTASMTTGGSPVVAPAQSSQQGTTSVVGSTSPAASSGHGCAFVLVVPFTAVASGFRRLACRWRSR